MKTSMKKILCLLLAAILLTGALPLPSARADAAAAVYYTNPEGWGTVYGYVWQIGHEGSGWPGVLLSRDAKGGYRLDVSAYAGKSIGVIFSDGAGKQTADLAIEGIAAGKEYWCSAHDQSVDPDPLYRTNAPGCGETVVVHFNKNSTSWSSVSGYAWYNQNGMSPELAGQWPGTALKENAANPGWYDLVITDPPVDSINVIFSGSGQTGDIALNTATKKEFWVTGASASSASTQKPTGWQSYDVTLHFYNGQNWPAVHAYAWDSTGRYDYCGAWPGQQLGENADHMGWYDMILPGAQSDSVGCVFSDGVGGEGKQTGDISLGDLSQKAQNGKVELWYLNGQLYASAPAKWSEGYSAPSGRQFAVAGTFPGNQWSTGSNLMSYTGKDGIYSYTFQNVPTGTYQFKITVNDGWTENYGVDGIQDGRNHTVTLSKPGDVTVWYSDISHRAVTSETYDVSREVFLSGGELPKTRLTDRYLTGIYTATVTLPAGTHSGMRIQNGSQTYSLKSITLTKPAAVTFFVDPAAGSYYHDAMTGEPVDASRVYFSTKDTAFKSVMGAVPNDNSTTFRILTGTEVTFARLVVGRGENVVVSTVMKAENVSGGKAFSCNPNFAGCELADDYWYYFDLYSEGGEMKRYSDDKGDWGEGKLWAPGQEWSYNLVIYKNGFKTPDWLKDAVIYQIFPDRFFNGDTSNDRAQTGARGDVDYEFPTWEQLPENPSLIGKPNYPSNAFKGDGEYSNEIYGGDLEGITQKINYLKALGVTVIYLNPIFSSISNHRYDACDYETIDPILGTLGDFTDLVKAAEANGMHIILDGVFNHVSDDSVYFDRYYKFLGKSEKIGAYPYWAYVYDLVNEKSYSLTNAKSAAKTYFRQKYGITDFSYTEWFEIRNTKCTYSDSIGLRAGKKVYAYEGWWGYDSMPVILSTNGSEYQTGNWAQEIIYNEQGTSVTQYWIAKGSDGWRLDVANEVSDETWQRFRESVKSMNSSAVTVLADGSTTYDDGADAAIVGEIWSDAAYYLLGDMYDSVMNYLFRDAAAGFVRTYRINRDDKNYNLDDHYTAMDALNTLESTRERYPQEAFYALMNLVGSHDTARILSYLDGVEDDGWGKENMQKAYPSYASTGAKAKRLQYVMALIQFTYPGAPTIYYGDEIGMVGSDDPDDRRAFTWGKGNAQLLQWYATLAKIRNSYAALRTGSLIPFAPTDDVVGYVRKGSDGTFIILANRLGTDQTVTVHLGDLDATGVDKLTDLLTGTAYSINGDSVRIKVPAYSGVILKDGTAAKVTLSAAEVAALAPAYDPNATGKLPEDPQDPPATEPSQPGQDPTLPGDTTQPGQDATQPGGPTQPGQDTTQPGGPTQPGQDATQPGDTTRPGQDATQPGGTTQPGQDTTQPGGMTQPGQDATQPGGSTQPEQNPTQTEQTQFPDGSAPSAPTEQAGQGDQESVGEQEKDADQATWIIIVLALMAAAAYPAYALMKKRRAAS